MTDYIKLGASVVVIGQGEPERSKDYTVKRNGIPCSVLCDPTFSVYEAYDLLEGKPSQIVYDAHLMSTFDIDYETGVRIAEVASRHRRCVWWIAHGSCQENLSLIKQA